MATFNMLDFHQQSLYVQANKYYKDWGKIALNKQQSKITYHFQPHFHPYIGELLGQLNRYSLAGLLDVGFHESLREEFFAALYQPTTSDSKRMAVTHEPKLIDVSEGGAYSIYNWELLFHVPMTVAVHLSKNQRFAEAQRWFHFIFDPTSTETGVPAPKRFWKFLAFRQKSDVELIDELLTLLAKPAAECSDAELEKQAAIISQIEGWRDKPFQPHAIARTRFVAYQFQVVMKYIDNLVAWGDSLFRQDTIETINEATQLYVLAAGILGPRPQEVPRRGTSGPQTFHSLRGQLDAFGNALVELENQFPFNQYTPGVQNGNNDQANNLLGVGRSLYFCIPPNEKLLSYWDLVADRLFKIRHCMNIEGIVRQLPLFEPPIDPGMLVKAAAAGIDLSSVISGLNQPPMPVRALFLLQKAQEVCSELRVLGNNLLAALEKKDAESLQLLRQQQDLAIQEMARDLRFLQWKEAEAQTEALERSRKSAFERYRHYQLMIGKDEKEMGAEKEIEIKRQPLLEGSDFEEAQKFFESLYEELKENLASEIEEEGYALKGKAGASNPSSQSGASGLGLLNLNLNEALELNELLPKMKDYQIAAYALEKSAPILGMIPQFPINLHYWGIGGTIELGGEQLSKAAKFGADLLTKLGSIENINAGSTGKTGNYERRLEDWTMQSNIAARDITQIGQQIVAAQIREQIAQKEFETQSRQIEFSRDIGAFLQDKFSNEQLYTWMQSELSKVYYECYKFAYDTARQAERAVKRELMRPELDQRDFLKFNYWDGGRKGLLSGDALYLDLKRLEMAYHEHNKREYEMTKHVSLRQLDPMALLRLRATGSCTVAIPEWVFDLDAPGHYLRRLKAVGLSIPCITGPYTSVNCTLSLQKSSIRMSPLLRDGEYARSVEEVDERFVDYLGAIQSIVTSSAQNDSGLFELDLRDERYLPFEGAGAESTWRLELPADLRQFDYASISDVILHLRYTARPAGGPLQTGAVQHLRENIIANANTSGLARVFSLAQDFPNEWHQFLNGTGNFQAVIRREHFPYFAQAGDLVLDTENTSLELQLWAIDGEELVPLPLTRAQISDTLPLEGAARIAHSLTDLNEIARAGAIEIARSAIGDARQVFLLARYRVDL